MIKERLVEQNQMKDLEEEDIELILRITSLLQRMFKD